MKRKKAFDLTESQKNKIISAAYGNGSLADRLSVRRLVSTNDEAAKIYLEYKQTAAEVRRLSEEECPHEILQGIQHKTIRALENKSSFIFDLYSAIFSKPIISAVTTIILVASIIIAVVINRPVQYNYSQEQIIKADKQAREAFAIVGEILNKTQSTLRKDVLSEKVSKPLNQSIGIVNNLFKGEKK